MKNQQLWSPSKFEFRRGKFRASSDTNEVSVSSRLLADKIASVYEQAIPEFAAGRLLDVGCGKVPMYSLYKPFIEHVECVDWAESLHGNVFLDHVCDLNSTLPLNSETYDTIIVSDVLEHIYNPLQLLIEIERLSTTGGHILINVPFYYWIHEEPHDYYRYTEYALKRMIEEVGLEVVRFEYLGGAFEILADLIGKLSADIPIVGQFLSRLIYFFCTFISNSMFGQWIHDRSSRKYPFGYFLVARKPK